SRPPRAAGRAVSRAGRLASKPARVTRSRALRDACSAAQGSSTGGTGGVGVAGGVVGGVDGVEGTDPPLGSIAPIADELAGRRRWAKSRITYGETGPDLIVDAAFRSQSVIVCATGARIASGLASSVNVSPVRLALFTSVFPTVHALLQALLAPDWFHTRL